ncbi:MAG TPA: thiamine pyrophosphate-dependent enzyme [Termitinemataceae bacterium]|uniref:thiamine pyrophosphate-dependent enzyme n=1 Tax=Treponema sp. J25 TaxID=2094121 RepID=UPI00104E36BA|nr:thiamine pyrophosphate-dependent enzyme [Treponema sp. J25]TCW60868.1 indolepyruvate ferredoxin oxidoreductase [Treponema sp. J25]HOJ99674.1 thiamine pyrophosphate-dependent enzyme [Termitinemataceae bacterium]HOM23813.1 thiamine pyrophosphate-dependent enzyme [Termitinemataceae bacterium]HPQ00890.1 thiamine pyrophosphate-dependent enzyme [Termitinemataceae bacterium]
MTEMTLLGDEAVALGAIHAGLTAAYGYPGTPSTEIMEFLQERYAAGLGPLAQWCTNEKTALEAALGVSFAGRRSLVTMKHVGLNVASDPFVNGALVGIKGGLVIAVADDPGMHSSQNEQDSRFYASFALVPCMEPRNQQEAYEMTREAFEVSERFHVPVLLRLVTRLSHSRAPVSPRQEQAENPLEKTNDRSEWLLLPAFARRRYQSLLDRQGALIQWSESHLVNRLITEGRDVRRVVITTGLGGNYFEENLEDYRTVSQLPVHLHIGVYPLPVDLIRRACEKAADVLVIEEGQPFLERYLRGLLPLPLRIRGKLDNTLPPTGELDPDVVRAALGLAPRPVLQVSIPPVPGRPPQLCTGCPHGDSYATLQKAVEGLESVAITADIGCYALGATPPYNVPETVVCMGASVNMAKGASDAGIKHCIGVIGDSTFLHSGITPLIDVVAHQTPMTLVILDNSIVAMTGCQDTMLPSEQLVSLIRGIGIDPEHLIVLETKRALIEENARRLRKEIEYPGPSVVIFKRECLEALKKRKKQEEARARGIPACDERAPGQ